MNDLPQDAPPLDEAWQAKAFALVFALSRGGLFAWSDWTERFGAEIARAPQSDGESAEEAYYRQWTTALETLLADHGLADRAAIDDHAEHWRRSYANTPHGAPVIFRRTWPDGPEHHDHDHDHDDHHHHALPCPIAVSPGRR